MHKTLLASSLALLIAGTASAATIDSHTLPYGARMDDDYNGGTIAAADLALDVSGTAGWINWATGDSDTDSIFTGLLTEVGEFTASTGGFPQGEALVLTAGASSFTNSISAVETSGATPSLSTLDIGEGWTYQLTGLAAGQYVLTNYITGRRNPNSTISVNVDSDPEVTLNTNFTAGKNGEFGRNDTIARAIFTVDSEATTVTFSLLNGNVSDVGGTDWLGIRASTLSLVPEPGTYALLSGFLALSFVAIRRRKA